MLCGQTLRSTSHLLHMCPTGSPFFEMPEERLLTCVTTFVTRNRSPRRRSTPNFSIASSFGFSSKFNPLARPFVSESQKSKSRINPLARPFHPRVNLDSTLASLNSPHIPRREAQPSNFNTNSHIAHAIPASASAANYSHIAHAITVPVPTATPLSINASPDARAYAQNQHIATAICEPVTMTACPPHTVQAVTAPSYEAYSLESRVRTIQRTATRPNTEQLYELFTPSPLSHLISENVKSIQMIHHHLRDYPDRSLPNTLIGIRRYGARVGFVGHAKHTKHSNHSSIHNHMDVIDKYIEKEVAAGRIREVHTPPSSYFCSPLGLVPKKRDGKQTGWRMIFDLSYPHGRSVNDGIPKLYGTLQYESFQHALQVIARSGRNSLLLKKDLQAAFRHVSISPLDWHLLLFHWQGKYYVDTCLPFGLRTSPRLYNFFAEAIHWTLEHSLLRDYLCNPVDNAP